MFRIIWSFFALLLLAGCGEQPRKEETVRPVKAVKVGDPRLVGSRAFPMQTRAEERTNLAFRVSGPLIERPASVGDEVKQRELLARIDPRDFNVELMNAQAELEKAKAELTFATNDYERALNIQKRDPGAISKSLVDQKKEEVNKLKAAVLSYQSRVDAARDALADTTLRAPFNGTVVATYVENYEYVQAQQPIIRILNTDRIEMVIDVPESLISSIPEVQKVVVTFDSFPEKKFHATIKEVGIEPIVTTRTYPVTLVMDQPKGVEVLAGMAGEARLYGEAKERKDSVPLEVPISALFSDGEKGKTYVWRIDPDTKTVHKTEVESGRFTESGAVVQNGLSPGDWIVTAGVHSLKEGQKVSILDQE